MKKLNRRGYLTIEIILASVMTFVIAFFLIDLTMNFSDKTDFAYDDAVLTTDKALVMKNIKAYLEEDICDYGGISNVFCGNNNVCTIRFNDISTPAYLKAEPDDNGEFFIEYNGINNDYTKKLDDSLSEVTIGYPVSKLNGYYGFKISAENMFLDDTYDINIFVRGECE